MARRVLPLAVCVAYVALLAGCSLYERAQRPAWRTQAENACLAQGLIRVSAFIQPAREIDGPGICGLTRPFKISALQNGAVSINSPSTLDCPMIATLDAWLKDVVQPVALARLQQPVTAIRSMGSYACRSMNNQPGARISEHAFGNALDIGGFQLADGREISIQRDWKGSDEETRAFLRDIHAGACGYFTTVLGPGSNVFHYNHIHVDLAMHGSTSSGPRRVCRPALQQAPLPDRPSDGLPDPPSIDDEIDIAQAGAPPLPPRAVRAGPLPPPTASLPSSSLALPVRRPITVSSAPLPPAPVPRAPLASAPVPPAAVPTSPGGRFIAQNRTAPREGDPSDWDLPPPESRRW
jgi:hypothetical protein